MFDLFNRCDHPVVTGWCKQTDFLRVYNTIDPFTGEVLETKRYCYYHDKMKRGLLEPIREDAPGDFSYN